MPIEHASTAKQLLDCLSSTPCKSITPEAMTVKEHAPFSSKQQSATTSGYNNGNDMFGLQSALWKWEASISSQLQFSILDWITLIGFHRCFSNFDVH